MFWDVELIARRKTSISLRCGTYAEIRSISAGAGE